MKEEIIIISDLWGIGKSKWINLFTREVKDNYSIKFYDACELGEINIKPYDQENIHKQFIDFGIDTAVGNLTQAEDSKKKIIGCSIGGLIAWIAGTKGMEIDKLITISSTRLRHQSLKPKCESYNFFGSEDLNKPKSMWMNSVGINSTRILKGSHDIYKDLSTIKEILKHSNLKV